ncbi:acyltransferase family protein [Persicobacter diffluens]|uniref:Membrane protein n=1 Tax=Persicobacter diffluens TaxID=981 RepID=A0AAN4W240_9BACT|nr:membrane protein [Persicobacter diffluens]
MSAVPKSKRLKSLDIFRGFTMLLMILVNNPGDWDQLYYPLKHKVWHGCSLTDLIFPYFIFMMGVSMTFSLKKAKEVPEFRKSAYLKALKRGGKLIAIGLFINLLPFFEFDTWRYFGVLQRIGIIFICCVPLYFNTDWKGLLALAIIILGGYFAFINYVPVPGVGLPDLDLKDQNIGAYIDYALFKDHLWIHSKTWDPEGLISTIPAVVTAILGLLSGLWIQAKRANGFELVAGLFIGGFALLVLGEWWGLSFPINKSLWTSSFVLYSGGYSLMTLGLFYWLLDIHQVSSPLWKIFEVFGTNAIGAFIFSNLLVKFFEFFTIDGLNLLSLFYQQLILPAFEPKTASLVYALIITSVNFIPMWWLYRKNIILKV